ncbi:hypothetical protein BGZ76_008973 [Entomortierella beljakovae]|nr:hypothetical protein BGZ76_008973 [Entomortierella beljakovae]
MDTLGATGPQDQVGFMWVEVAGFIVRTPSLKRINISSQRNGLPIQVWEAIAFAPNIKALHLDHVKIGISDIQSFWTACQDLEILELDACIVNDRFGPQRLFSKMTDMKLENLMNHSNSLFQVELMSSCPNIKNIYWRGGSFSYFPLDQFSTTIEEGRLKYLDSIDLQGEMISDIQVCRVINAIQQPIKKLGVQMTKIGGLSFAALEPHFNSLQELDLTGCQLPTSKDILMFLRSCKQLISFKAFSIFSSDIEVEEGWPCSRQLSTLYLNIQIDEVDQKEASDRVFRCLSKLVMLKNLNITRYVANLADIPLESKPLQLRLGYGLSQLSTLRRLEMFTFGSHQFMSIEDGIWIRDNLKRLIAVRGVYNPDPRINNQKNQSSVDDIP